MIAEAQIKSNIKELYIDAKNDRFNIRKGLIKRLFRPMRPSDFKNAYLSISKKQGEDLQQLIKENNCKNIVEFGTSFGISTLFMALGAIATNGKIITTEIVPSKAEKAIENFKKAGVNHLIEVRVGDALETLNNHNEPIDLLFLDGWKELYLPLFQLLEPNFHQQTLVYVDNANMSESKAFLKTISQNKNYTLQPQYDGRVVLVTKNNKNT